MFVIVGDLNLTRLRPESREGNVLKDIEEVQSMITEATRITIKSETLLDVILTNNPDMFKECGTFNPEISDHNLIYGIMEESVNQCKPKTIVFRSMKKLDVKEFNEEIHNAPWSVGETYDTLNDQYDYWETLLGTIMDEHIPQKRMRVRETDVPYMTTEWKQAIRNKRKYAQIYAKSRTPENWENKRKWRNIATKERRKAIKDFWREKTKEIAIKPRQFFKLLNHLSVINKCKN